MEDNKIKSAIKFKAAEAKFRSTLPSQSIIGMRLDGKAFRTFTKQFDRPYDYKFMDGMDAVGLHMVSKNLNGAMFAYVQSDEVTVFFTDLNGTKRTHLFNGGRVEKILSNTASVATGVFMKELPDVEGIPVFDCRVFVLNNMDEVQEYMDWRRLDARKNSISMAASTLYSEKQLRGVSTRGRAELLKGTRFERLPEGFFEGRLFVKRNRIEEISYIHGRTGKPQTVSTEIYYWANTVATRENTAAEVERQRALIEG